MAWIVTTVIALVICTIAVALYRLFFSPLAKVPGPKLAALTGWYETYFELFHGYGGQFTFHIQELHKQYGPIVRINPWEVHIDDPEFFDSIYNARDASDKPVHLKWRFGSPNALFSTPEHGLYRMRRASQDPFFAKGRIQRLAPEIQAMADRMCNRLQRDFKGTDRLVILNDLFTSYTAEVTAKYSFNRDFKYLEHGNFESPFVKAIRGFKDIGQSCTQFPLLGLLLSAIPERIVRYLQPAMASVREFQEEMRKLIHQAQEELKENKDETKDKTIMHGILLSNLPADEKDVERLKDQAAGLVGAGIASPQWTMTIACYHIISDRQVWAKLRKELEDTMPDPSTPASLLQLERLPYLTACVDEAIRPACGQVARSPRVSRRTITYDSYTMPPGTLISLDTWHMHHNEELYLQSFDFRPERWLGEPLAPSGRPLKYYMTSFMPLLRR